MSRFFRCTSCANQLARAAMDDDTTITRIRLDPTALREGYRAGRRGLTGEANPYQVGTHEAIAWQLGLAEGRTKRLKPVDGR